MEYLLNARLRGLDLSRRGRKVIYLKHLVRLYRALRYDVVPFEVVPNPPRDNVLLARDAAHLSRGLGAWADEHRGAVRAVDDFESYPWPDAEEPLDNEMFELLGKLPPEGMAIAGGTGGGVLERTIWLMGHSPFFRALYRDRRLVELVSNRVGELISEAMKVIAEYDEVAILRNGDDWGMRKGPFISPQLMSRYVLPWYGEIVKVAHKHGKPYILHSCGNLKVLMRDIIDYVNIDGKHSYEDAIMPVTEAKRTCG